MGLGQKEKLNPSELKNKLLLAKDHYGYTAWDRAAIEGSLEALETLWCWAKEAGLNLNKCLLQKKAKIKTSDKWQLKKKT